MWIPWTGANYRSGGTLLLLESCYDWMDGDVWRTPQPDHPIIIVRDSIERFAHGSPSMRKLTRGLAGTITPTIAEMQAAWDRVALTNYVPVTVGQAAETRLTPEMWKMARLEFPFMLDRLQPGLVLVLSFTVWKNLPSPTTANVRTFKYGTGAYVFDKHQHPARGPKWTYYRDVFAHALTTGTPFPSQVREIAPEQEPLTEVEAPDDVKG